MFLQVLLVDLLFKKINMNNIFASTVIVNIYNNLSLKDSFNCSMINKKFNKLFNENNFLWKRLFNEHFGEEIYKVVSVTYNTSNCKILFKKCLDLEKCAKDCINGEFEFNETVVKELLCTNLMKCSNTHALHGIDSMIGLKYLSFYGLDVSDIIIEKIGSMVNLKKLVIYNTNLNDISGFCKLKNLDTLVLGGCGITNINTEISNLKNLRTLILFDNFISDISSIVDLPELLTLDLSNNIISVLSLNICTLGKLKSLLLGANHINHIPQEIKNLSSLEQLVLCNNELEEFSVSFCSLPSLTNLSLSNNKIQIIPSEITTLTKLSSLNLSYNNLSELPPLSSLVNLRNLDISGNDNIKFLPKDLPSSMIINW